MESKGTALVTGASTGIGAVYADRLARRGYDLIIAARDRDRLEALAQRLRSEYGVKVSVVRSDLSASADVENIEKLVAATPDIRVVINNAGAALRGGFAEPESSDIDALIRLNVTAVARIAHASVRAFLANGGGSLVNIASVLAVVPERSLGVYGATKAFVLSLSQSLQAEFGDQGIYVQAVLPAATRTEIWERSDRDVNQLPGVMDTGDLVDAALAGFDQREAITIPPLPDAAQWTAYDTARKAMLPNFFNAQPADRYRVTA